MTHPKTPPWRTNQLSAVLLAGGDISLLRDVAAKVKYRSMEIDPTGRISYFPGEEGAHRTALNNADEMKQKEKQMYDDADNDGDGTTNKNDPDPNNPEVSGVKDANKPSLSLPSGSGRGKASTGGVNQTTQVNNNSSPALNTMDVAKKIVNADRVGTALSKTDLYHRAGSFLTQFQLSKGTVSYITGGDKVQRILLQVEGAVNGVKGVFEYILQSDGTVSHQLFTPNN